MKKLILLLCTLLLFGCQKEMPVEVAEEVILIDTDAYHNIKLKTYNNTIPYIINKYVEMDDEQYGAYNIEMYDTNYDPVWKFSWRDLDKNLGSLNGEPYIYENKLIVNIQGIISVHDLVTGTYNWELETTTETKVIASNDILYVLNYQDNYITGLDIETGKVVLEIKDDSYIMSNALAVDENMLIAYSESNSSTRNAVAFELDGTYKKRMQYKPITPNSIVWDTVETSDESEVGHYLIDGSTKTMWQEGVKGYGEKEWVEITKIIPVMVNKLTIVNGDQTSEKAYGENAKLKTITLSVGDGKSFTYKFSKFEYGFKDEIEFVKPIVADYIMLTIVEAEPGGLFKNTCVTEIETE